MLRDDLLKLLRARPFVPFRIAMNNDDEYDVRHPEFVHVGPNSIYYYYPGPTPPEVSDFRILSILLVKHLELLPAGKAAPVAQSA